MQMRAMQPPDLQKGLLSGSLLGKKDWQNAVLFSMIGKGNMLMTQDVTFLLGKEDWGDAVLVRVIQEGDTLLFIQILQQRLQCICLATPRRQMQC